MSLQRSRAGLTETPVDNFRNTIVDYGRRRAIATILAGSIGLTTGFASATITCARDESAPVTGRTSTYRARSYDAAWTHVSTQATAPRRHVSSTATDAPDDIRQIAILEGMRATQEGLKENLLGFLHLPPGWNSYDAPPVSADTIAAALTALAELYVLNTPPDRVLPSPSGGVALAYGRGPRKADIEFFPDREVLLLLRAPRENLPPVVIDVDPAAIEAAVRRLRDWLRA